jgi:GLPGLI family protein
MQGDFFILTREIHDWELNSEQKKIGKYICYSAVSKSNPHIKGWYTPEIPVQHGPLYYNNLPGLILELENKVSIFKAINISLFKEKIKIKRPTKGTVVNIEEFKKLFGGVLKE